MSTVRTKTVKRGRWKGEAPSDEKCGAAGRKGKPCALPAGHGTDHPGIGRCSKHGGNTANHVKSAQREIAHREVESLGLPREVDPHTALLEELARTAGHVQWLGMKVREMQEHELVGPTGSEGTDAKTGLQHYPTAEYNVWVRLYQDERKQLTLVATACIKAGIEERRVRLAEQQGQLIAQVLVAVLQDLGVDTGAEKTRRIVRKHLTAIEGTAVEAA